MKKVLLIILFFVGLTSLYSNLGYTEVDVLAFTNDKTFSFELDATSTEQSITILSDVKEPMLIKIIDKSGFIRIQKKLHLDREIDLALLDEGLYLIKVHVGNHMKVKRFYKGNDGVDIR
ncbi:T9SS C-terminal target domain-containing protein [Aquimarina sp. BL5]|uniref:T9SS type A sorting domain-containing protein n=1 Tax=Aquimarina sp. BL5 TaxID=1714860 RepID=UPI000E4A8726|nr:T9SS type A sorting domain-containing protein [Aquimarina sp. BL5]AXT53213.1 T9SS C-terminal target domain-containing protein [Aquimarina sp. BL5]RKM87653.1 T9SS C-terminal target domain-containing protein [Aquimarina sp. BL5]